MNTLSIVGIVVGVIILILLIAALLNLTFKSSGSPSNSCGSNSCSYGGGAKETPKIILFYADWCGYCQQIKPTWRKLEREYPGVVVSVDSELRPNQKNLFNVTGFPTIIYAPAGLENAANAEVYEGSRDESSLREFINSKF